MNVRLTEAEAIERIRSTLSIYLKGEDGESRRLVRMKARVKKLKMKQRAKAKKWGKR